MKRLVIFLICFICVVGCSNNEKVELYKTISSDEAYEIMLERKNIYIVDVRNKSEYDKGHIKNSINVPLNEIEKIFKDEVTDNLDTTILVYCQSGARSKEASEKLGKMGFTDVNNFGGLSVWPYEVVVSEEGGE